eukprot:268079-Rhodomonas_salina.2
MDQGTPGRGQITPVSLGSHRYPRVPGYPGTQMCFSFTTMYSCWYPGTRLVPGYPDTLVPSTRVPAYPGTAQKCGFCSVASFHAKVVSSAVSNFEAFSSAVLEAKTQNVSARYPGTRLPVPEYPSTRGPGLPFH